MQKTRIFYRKKTNNGLHFIGLKPDAFDSYVKFTAVYKSGFTTSFKHRPRTDFRHKIRQGGWNYNSGNKLILDHTLYIKTLLKAGFFSAANDMFAQTQIELQHCV